MNTLIVDDKQLAVDALTRILHSINPEGVHTGVLSAKDAMAFLKQNKVDVAFLDIEMPEMNGLMLAKRIKDIQGQANIVFVTGYSEYALEAHQLYVSGYLMKPVDEQEVIQALEHLRNPVKLQHHSRIQIQCFGNFEVFADGVPLHFRRSKTKEMLAYLVDRQGASCMGGEILAVLWDDKFVTRSLRGQLRNLIHDLKSVLEENGAEDILIRRNNSIAINKNMVDCDYFDFMNHIPSAVNLYHGEYMSQYSWAELTIGQLDLI